MTALLWVGAGVSLGAALLHGVLGAMRPLSAKHASFALLMAFQCFFFYFERRLYQAASAEAVVEALRATSVMALCMLAVLPWFVCHYTGARVRRRTAVLFWSAIAGMSVYNLLSPHGIYFASPPTILRVQMLGGEVVTNFTTPFGLSLLCFTATTFGVPLWSLRIGLITLRRGGVQAGLILVSSIAVMLLGAGLDIFRDLVGGRWPYVFEYGAAVFALAMSVDLAVVHRSRERELMRMLAASLAARDQLNTPLQSLELGLALLHERAPEQATEIARLQRAVLRLSEAGRLLQSPRHD